MVDKISGGEERKIVIHKEDGGYGFTVSGDNPVYVQSIKSNAAAQKAGVKVGDQILEVNGTKVMTSNHIEVVHLIRSQAFVTLMLLTAPLAKDDLHLKPTHSAPPHKSGHTRARSLGNSHSILSAAESKKSDRTAELSRTLNQEREYHQQILKEYMQTPTPRSQKDLAESQTRINAIEHQIKALTGAIPQKSQSISCSSSLYRPLSSGAPASTAAVPAVLRGGNAAQRQPATRTQSLRSSGSASHVGVNGGWSFHPREGRVNEEATPIDDAEFPAPPVKQQRKVSKTNSADLPSNLLNSTSSVLSSSSTINSLTNSSTEPLSNNRRSAALDISVESTNSVIIEEQATSTSVNTESNFTPTISNSAPVSSESVRPASIAANMEIQVVDHSGDPIRRSSDSGMNDFRVPTISNYSDFDSMFQQAQHNNLFNPVPLHGAPSVISMEDDEFDVSNENFSDHGPFVDLRALLDKPAHLSVFIHYLISNNEPSALFFLLVTVNFSSEQGNVKDLKKWAYEIFSTFVAQSAPLKVNIPKPEELAIEEALESARTTEERMRSVFEVSWRNVFSDVSEQLADFRNTRALGLGGLFGDHQLEDYRGQPLDRTKELRVVETTLMPHLETLMSHTDASEGPVSDRNLAMASALATFMKQAGVSGKASVSGAGNSLDRCRSFAERSKSTLFSLKPKKGRTWSVNGHQFVDTQYSSLTLCSHCRGLLWGIGAQGLQCQNCEFNVHRDCFELLADSPICQGGFDKDGKLKKKKPGVYRAGMEHGQYRSIDQKTGSNARVLRDASLDKENFPSQKISSGSEYNEQEFGVDGVDHWVATVSSAKEKCLSGDESALETSLGNSGEEQAAELEKDLALRTVTPSEEHLSSQQKSKTIPATRTTKPTYTTSTKNVSRSDSSKSTVQPFRIGWVPGMRVKSETSIGGTENGLQSQSPPLQDLTEAYAKDFEDPDLDVETEVPNWQTVADKKVLKRLKRQDIKRQEVIHELIHTEKTHVRNLKVLRVVFYLPMINYDDVPELPLELVMRLFPNIDELIRAHVDLLRMLTQAVEEAEDEVIDNISEICLKAFDGAAGERLQEVEANFCTHQKDSLERLKQLRRKDPKLSAFIAERESHPLCRRLMFTALYASTHHRLVKYPMLFDSILKATPPTHSDHDGVEKCKQVAKNILQYVNQKIKESENKVRLEELSQKIEDKRPINEMSEKGEDELFLRVRDITTYKLIYEGDLTWRQSSTQTKELHVVLLNTLLILLQKQDDKYILKNHSYTAVSQVNTDSKMSHSPVKKVESLLTRNVATDKRAFFLVSTSMKGPQIYDLVAATTTERRIWVKNITEAADGVKTKDHSSERAGRRGTTGTSLSSSSVPEETEEKESDDESDVDVDERTTPSDMTTSPTDVASSVGTVDSSDQARQSSTTPESPTVQKRGDLASESSSSVSRDEDASRSRVPSEERRQQLYSELSRKDGELQRILDEKSRIVAELRGESSSSTSLSSEADCTADPRALVLSSMEQVTRIEHACSLDLSANHNAPVKNRPASDSDAQQQDIPPRIDGVHEALTTLNELLSSLLGAVTNHDRRSASHNGHHHHHHHQSPTSERCVDPMSAQNVPELRIVNGATRGAEIAERNEDQITADLVTSPFHIICPRSVSPQPPAPPPHQSSPHQSSPHQPQSPSQSHRSASFSGTTNRPPISDPRQSHRT